MFHSGHDFSEPGIGLGRLVLQSLPTHHHNPPLPPSAFFFFFSGHERFEPGIGLGGLAPSPLPPTTSTIPPLPFFRVIFFFGLLNLPSLVREGIFLGRNRALPRPLCSPRRKVRAFHPGYRFGWTTSPSIPTHHHRPPPSTGDAYTVHLFF